MEGVECLDVTEAWAVAACALSDAAFRPSRVEVRILDVETVKVTCVCITFGVLVAAFDVVRVVLTFYLSVLTCLVTLCRIIYAKLDVVRFVVTEFVLSLDYGGVSPCRLLGRLRIWGLPSSF